jgi:hypothetical protein
LGTGIRNNVTAPDGHIFVARRFVMLLRLLRAVLSVVVEEPVILFRN